jgi:DNA-binding SARP family transcriptional activator
MQAWHGLPAGYRLELDPDSTILRRPDDSIAAIFNVRGSASPAIREAALADAERETAEAHRAPSPELEARFFGHFELLCDGEAVPLGHNEKALAVLKYLLADRSRPASQDHLMGWLWPESNAKRARWSLNTTVRVLRKLLGGCAPAASFDHVVLDKGCYSLCPTLRVWTDADEFHARYERGRLADRAGLIPEATNEYESATRLYRGVYLADDPYEDWTTFERERLAAIYTEMLDRLALHSIRLGRYRASIGYCYKLLDQDRSHEVSYRRLIECYVRLGMRGEALRQYGFCRETLSKEYGLDPSPDTEALLATFMDERERIRVALAASSRAERKDAPQGAGRAELG